MDSRIELLLDVIDRAFDKAAWHGTTLKGSLRGLKPKTALWRPAPDRHNIWELVLHAAYWKYIVTRRLTGDTETRFPRSPSDWPRIPDEPTQAALTRDVALLVAEHARLRGAVAPGWPVLRLVHGIAAHDLYHTGQIPLLKRLQ